jgi:FlaA1/EpsC-like NDP-sugar epimerase
MAPSLRVSLQIVSVDILLMIAAWTGAFWLRFNFDVPDNYREAAISFLPFVVTVQLAVTLFFKLHRIIARFASTKDLARIIVASAVAVTATATAIFLVNRLQQVPRSVFILDFILLVFFLGGIRLMWRMFKERPFHARTGKGVAIIGAGQGGEQLVRDMLSRDNSGYWPVGFLDDDRKKMNRSIQGVPVLGRPRDLCRLKNSYPIEMVFLAIPSADKRAIARFMDICREAGLPCRTLPSIHSILSGNVQVASLRKITVEDLLGRDPVKLDWEIIRSDITGKCVLVSGAGGSIGSELCRQIARLSPSKLILFEASELALYQIDMELTNLFPDIKRIPVLGDVKDIQSLEKIFSTELPDIVFHAAAYKHVPMVEMNPEAGIKTNILGTKNIADTASRFKTGKFVTISTDKAINPANIMGMTKRVAEIYCQNLDKISDTAFITTRFGNVLGSSGSVVPLFRKQVAAGGPVTVTHKDIERFFMTIPEACQLVLQASAIGTGGEIFVLDMGEPVKIRELAEQIITLSGFRPYEDIKIEFTGLRPGEKMYEELFYSDEDMLKTRHSKILLARSREMAEDLIFEKMDELKKACKAGDMAAMTSILRQLVPEYTG